MVKKGEIVSYIHSAAKADGKQPGRDRFEKAKGIKRHEWHGLHWAKWGGCAERRRPLPNEFQSQLGSEAILAAYVGLVQKLGRVPSEGDIRLARRSDSTFPSHSTLGLHIGLRRERLISASEYATNNSFDASVVKILADAVQALPDEKIKVDIEVVGGNVTGFVCLMKSGKYHKIGRTNFIERRQYEVGLQLAEKNEPVHSMETDDPSGIETYWHRRFRDKHKNGEW